jgi:D-alanine-D-alanine ligase
LVEEGVRNLVEVTLPVMGNEQPRPALLERPAVHAEDFFDFDTKYMHGGKKGAKGGGKAGGKGATGAQGYSTIPADLPKKLYAKAEETGLAVYRALGCSGTARVDMLIDTKAQTVYCNEVNPLPGSLYQHNWNRAGVSNVVLAEKLVELALERHAGQSALETAFTTNFLKQF